MDYINKEKNAKLRLVYGDVTLGVHGSGFAYLFSWQSGGMESLVKDGREWLYRSPRPTFWRALTDNDRGCGFHLRSGMWLSADMFLRVTDSCVQVDGKDIPFPIAPENNRYTKEEIAEKIRILYTYETITVPSTKVTVVYEVTGGGKIKVEVHYYGKAALPELPVFGMRFVMPTKADGYEYEGLSGETYPDRMAGGEKGVYRIEGLPVTKYLVPQDCNVHMDTKRLTVYRSTTKNNAKKETGDFNLSFLAGDKHFAFSCIPYTAEELENATHQEELPLARRTVVCILGAVRGVGGINSWGADVEEACRIDAGKDICYSFEII